MFQIDHMFKCFLCAREAIASPFGLTVAIISLRGPGHPDACGPCAPGGVAVGSSLRSVPAAPPPQTSGPSRVANLPYRAARPDLPAFPCSTSPAALLWASFRAGWRAGAGARSVCPLRVARCPTMHQAKHRPAPSLVRRRSRSRRWRLGATRARFMLRRVAQATNGCAQT